MLDKASLALIPSGTKASKLYSVLPANGNGDFTHTRGSTATRVNKDGLIESVATNVPRLDYPLVDGVVQSCPVLLLEPSRTNLSEYSESFNNWGSGGSYVTANQAISPDGSLTADKLTKSGSFVQISEAATISSGVNYVFSVFVKADTGTHITLRQASGSNDVRRFFNLSDETSGASGGNQTGFVSEKIEQFSNNWFRVSTVCTSNGTSLAINIYAGKAGNTTFDGNIFLWGAQVEEGDFETSYTPNLSTGSTTRLIDDIDLTLPDVDSFNSSSGFSVIAKFDISEAGSGTSAPFILFNDDTSSTYIGFGTTSTNFRCRLNLSGSAYLNTQSNAPRTQKNSLFVSCDSSGWSQGANGSTNHTGSNDASVFDKMASITFITDESRGIVKISELLVYNTRLTNTELQTLTS
jgi:hypothetical protein|tara:strand:- start:4226 stop:5452 length:1227 start_codon:yes stop_codon:yes gene_type:complete